MSDRATRDVMKKRMLITLQQLCSNNSSPPYDHWPSTRQLAESCSVSIYQARNMLLDMVKKGDVLVSPLPVHRTLRWYPVKKTNSFRFF